jgi:hypothetical protein
MLILLVATTAAVQPSNVTSATAPLPIVRVVTDEASRKSCEYLGLVSVRKAMGPNKAAGALRKALDKVAQMGGNGLFLINQSQTWTDGASVSGEALRCPASALP